MKKFSLSTLCLTALLGMVLSAPGWGQLPTRVKDIVAGAGGSNPELLTAVGNTLYFTATDEANGRELWKSDGTAAGTVLVRDIRPGSEDSEIRQLTAVGNTLFFSANDGTNGQELWKSDGMAAGTVRVKDIWPGADGSSPSYLTVADGALFFTADDGTNGRELWKSDGTEAGTVLVKNINLTGGSGIFENMAVVGNTVFFRADDGVTGPELWKSDGTEAGTVLVKDINPGINTDDPNFPYPNGSFPSNLTAVGNTLYFSANDGTAGNELWKTDGTEAGTVLVKDINPGVGGSGIDNTAVVGNTLFFSANDGTTGRELWKTDGTGAGTVLVKDIAPGSSGSFPVEMEALGNMLFFRVEGLMLYKSDGTAAGTVLVKDLDPTSNLGGDPRDLAAFNGLIYFNGDDGALGDELWKSDGTEAGTVLVADINPGPDGSAPERKAVVGNTLYFTADDGTTGYELWKLDAPAPPCDTRVALYPATPSKICQGQALPVTFSTVGSCPNPAPNTFLVQLSSATGSFANPTNLGSAAPGTTALLLPTNLPVGTGYRVRILSGNPATPSSASAPFRVDGPSLSLTPGVAGAPVCRGQAVTVSFSLPVGSCAFPEGNVFTAQLSSASGSFASPVNLGAVVPGVSNSVVIPAGVAAGTGYRIRVVSSSPVLTSSASIPFRVNACVSRMSAEEPELVVMPNPVSTGREIRVRVSGIGNPAFGLTSSTGRGVGILVKTDPEASEGEFVLVPEQPLPPGVYALSARGGNTRLTRRVLVGP